MSDEIITTAAAIFIFLLFLAFARIPDAAKKQSRPSPDYNPAPAAGYWRKNKGIPDNQALPADQVPAGELWAGVDCNVPPVDVVFENPNCPPEWKDAYTQWPGQVRKTL